jgi:hypothetical protein
MGHPVYSFGENVTRIETKINPNRITSSGHQLSNQDSDSVDELIAIPSLTIFKTACEIASQILTEKAGALNRVRSARSR